MCGISAIFNYRSGSPINESELTAIRDAMRLRGPDDCGNWLSPDRRVGLAHRRLSIIDLSPTGAQPMKSADGSLVITFNGEIYNYRELRAQLEAKGRRFASQSDTEILLHLYELEGPAMLDKLRGMFAFAIWDARKQALFLARDPFGIKPLYYSDDGKTLRVASQVKALLAGGHIDTAPQPAGHVGFFLWGHVPAPYTLYRGISNLPAGHSMWVAQDAAPQLRRYCDIPAILADAERAARSMEHGARSKEQGARSSKPGAGSSGTLSPNSYLLSSALRDSVRHHLIADVPVGVFLSSGLDSTTIAALASQSSATLRTVTLGFEEFRGTPNDEVPLAEQVAAQYGARHQTIWITKNDFRQNFATLMQAMDQPTCDGINSFFISLAAAQAGLKVALSGLGGDELFAGYPSFRDIPRSVKTLGAWSKVQSVGRAFRIVTAPVLKRLTSPKYAGLLEYGGTYAGAYMLRRAMFMPWELPGLLDPDLVREGWGRLQPLVALESTISDLRSPRLKVSALEMTWYMRQQLLRDTDWASMGHSLEVRTPLVDIQLLKDLAPLLASAHPPSKHDMALTVGEKFEDSSSKLADRGSRFDAGTVDSAQTPNSHLLSPCLPLPPSVLNRRKTGFVTPVRDWLLSDPSAFSFLPFTGADARGLRGWTRLVYAEYWKGEERRTERVEGRSKLGARSSKMTRSPLPAPRSPLPAPCSPLPSPGFSGGERRKILVFRIGQLGDTIAALPAMWAVRNHFKDAELTLLCDRHPNKGYVFGPDLLRGSGLFDHFDFYPVHNPQKAESRKQKAEIQNAGISNFKFPISNFPGERPPLSPRSPLPPATLPLAHAAPLSSLPAPLSGLGRLGDMLKLLSRLKKEHFDTVVYLSPSARSPSQIARDVRFFRLAGIKNFIGTDGFAPAPIQIPGQPLQKVQHEAESLLSRLAASSIPVPASGGGGCMDLGLGANEQAEFQTWLAAEGSSSKIEVRNVPTGPNSDLLTPNSPLPAPRSMLPAPCSPLHAPNFVAFAPGSKMPAKRWPIDRFAEVGHALIDKFDIWPIVFGGAEDAPAAQRLLDSWGRGYNAAGQLSLRAAGFALKQCLLYIGNDTGTMHLAASVGTRCVAVFSARDFPGRWDPYGPGHHVLRAAIDCEGCGLVECLDRKNECLTRITVPQVLDACEAVMREVRSSKLEVSSSKLEVSSSKLGVSSSGPIS